jgi:hypothetical protein
MYVPDSNAMLSSSMGGLVFLGGVPAFKGLFCNNNNNAGFSSVLKLISYDDAAGPEIAEMEPKRLVNPL